jgi:hypothetical protein
VIHAINYAPTWQGWSAETPKGQPLSAFFDSDFANDGMVDLWGRENGGVPDLNPNNMTDGSQGRNDLATIAAEGYNVVRLYDWSPTRSDNGGTDNAHLNFLNYAYSLKPNDGYSQHLQVIVPVSAYFLSNDHYAWAFGNKEGYTDPVLDGKVSYAFDAAPKSIQDDLTAFINSITVTVNGQKMISPDVFAITVGNELDQAFQDQAPNGTKIGDTNDSAPYKVNAASKLARTEWWFVNLEAKLSQIPGGDKVLISNPASTADLDRGPISWFQAFVYGVPLGETVPNHTQNAVPGNPNAIGGRFEFSFVAPHAATRKVTGVIPGLASLPNSVQIPLYTNWYFNTYQPYQNPTGLKNIFLAYDKGGQVSPRVWNWNWPGQAFNVPLLLTETGVYRGQFNQEVPPADKGKAVDLTAVGQATQSQELVADATSMEAYIKQQRATPQGSEAMGYTFFEFNDEPTRKKGSEATFGTYMLAGTQPKPSLNGHYPKATTLYTATTNPQTYAGGPLNPKSYPVQQLFPVNGTTGTLSQELNKVFKGDAPSS